MHTRRQLIGTLATLGAAGAFTPSGTVLSAAADATPTAMGERLMAFLDEADRQDLALNPQAAVLRGDLAHAGDFGDLISDDYHRAAESLLRSRLAAFAGIERGMLSRPEQVAYDVWQYQARFALRLYDEGLVRVARQLPIDHVFGQHLAFAQFSSGSAGAPFRTLADYDAGLSRIDGFVVWIDRAVGRLREGLHAGRVQPRLVTDKVVTQLEQALALAPEASPFFGPVRALPASFAEAERQRLDAAYRRAITERIYPAFARLRDFLRGPYRTAGRTLRPGIGAMPDGARWYAYQLESHTTLATSPDAIHRTGLAEVARIRRSMAAIQSELGFKGTLAPFFERLKADPKLKYPSADALFAAYKGVHRLVEAALPRFFSSLPKSRLDFAAVPAEQESSASGAYYIVGTPDGNRPGVFYVNTSDLPSRTSPRVTALYLHEGMPGHHLQGSLAQEDETLPPTLRFGWNAGYGEGWALYAEWLGHEMGLYADPYQRFGQLDMEIFRAARMVVDTGLHARGWSRERAIDYLVANTSLERDYCALEVDRYIVWPGQACAYKLGELKIRALRSEAERALGRRFDVRAFHAQVLGTGALPLAVLERKIKDWIGGYA